MNTVAVSLALAGSFFFSHPSTSLAADSGTPDLSQREVQHQISIITEQQVRLSEAENLLREDKAEPALKIFEEIFTSLPDTPQAQEARTIALEGYLHAGLIRAKELADAGNYPAAQALLDKLDSPDIAKGDRRISRLRQRLTDPDRYPPALTPEHVSKVDQVTKLLTLAGSQRETGQYDKALATYEDVLRLDAYNTAARRGMELTEQDRARYLDSARDHARSKMLNDVNRSWEKPVSASSEDISGLFGSSSVSTNVPGVRGGRETIQKKLRDLRIERIDFSGASLDEVMEYLRVRSKDLDPAGKGVDFVVNTPRDQAARTISLNLRDVPIEEVLRYVTEMSGMTYRVEDYAVRIISTTESGNVIISKSYRVPPDFISSAPITDPAAGKASADPFATTQSPNTSNLQIRRMGAQEFLAGSGVTFGEGAGASYNPSSNMLVVRNTAKNLEIVDMLVEQVRNRSPKQVVIDVRLLEVGENRLKEIGFDWLLGSFGAGRGVDLGGGTTGNAQDASTFLTGDFPFQQAITGGSIPVGQNPVTAGLRSSGDLGTQGVDGVLFGSAPTVSKRSPGVLSLSGVFTSPQFQVVLRALDQKKGIDLAAQPSVVTRSGQKASVEVTRELIYPTEFDPPQIPTNFGTNRTVTSDDDEPLSFPPAVVTPSTPTAFEMRKTGVVLDVEPVISEDGRTVDLTVTPQFTEFSGFVNYGSPIRSLYQGTFFELTENLIFQPIFDVKKVVTSVKIWDGATVVLGGLVTDRDEIIQDKVPVLGDAPFVGRLFKSEVKRRMTKQIVFFVTVRVVDPAGNSASR